MATKIEAMVKYGPRIAPGRPVSTSQLIDLMVRNTGQSKGECKQSFTNVLEALTFYLYEGRSIHIDDWGSFASKIVLDGRFRVNFQEDPDLVEDVRKNFTCVIENSENIGKTMADLVAIWNADPANDDDQIPTS